MRVTIGIPFLNAQHTLADAIRSVFAQTFEDWELILVDDGSTDESLAIAKSITDPRIRVISDGVNRGLHARLNQISKLAKGDLLARMDSDDLMHPHRLQQQISALESDPELDIIGTGVYVIDAQTTPVEIRDTTPVDTRPQAVMAQAILPHPTVTGRTDWFRANPYDESYTRAEDYELWCRTYQKTHFGKISAPLYYFREGARDPRKYLDDYIQTARTVRKTLRRYGPSAVGWGHTRQLVMSSHAKEAIYRMATAIGMQSALIEMRHGPHLSDDEQKEAMDGLRIVLNTPVPGLPPPAIDNDRRGIR